MQKLELKSIYMLCQNYSPSHTEHRKIGFAILGFFYDFLWILQGAAQTHKGVKILFASRPLEHLKIHRYALRLRKRPWNYLGPCNVVLGMGAAEDRRIPARPRPKRVGGGVEDNLELG
jgi:hypothetical protein